MKLTTRSSYMCLNDEDDRVYSPVPAKYYSRLKNLSMNLRPRTLLNKSGILSTLYVPLKSQREKICNLSKNGIKKKEIKKSMRKKSNVWNKSIAKTPFVAYKHQLIQTPSTPNNPFKSVPTSDRIRRSKCLSTTKQTPKNKNIPPVSIHSAIKKLNLNSLELDRVERNCQKTIYSTNSSNIPSGWNYGPLLEEQFSKENLSPFEPNTTLRRTKSTLKRRLSMRFRKVSANKAECGLSQRDSNHLRGKYNQAHYFHG